jgi:MFS family permease
MATALEDEPALAFPRLLTPPAAEARRTQVLQRDLSSSVGDGAAYGVMVGVGETYLAAFVLAVGLGELTAGLIASLPQLAGGVMQMVTPRGVRRLGSHRRWVLLCAAVQGASFVPLVIAAVLGAIPAWAAFATAAVYWGAGMATSPAWNTWIGRLVPRRIRPRYFARRTRISQAAVLSGFLLGGVILQAGSAAGKPLLAFAVLFSLAAGCRAVSTWFLSRQSEPRPIPAIRSREPAWRLLGRLSRGEAGRLLRYMIVMQMAVQISGPFFAPYMLRQLSLSYADYVMLIATAFVAKIVALPLFGQFAYRFGPRKLLWLGGMGVVPTASLWLVSNSFGWLVLIQALSGTMWAAYELATFLLFFESIPEEERTSVLTLFNLMNAAALVLGSLAGGAILAALGATKGAYGVLFALSSCFRAMTVFQLRGIPETAVTMAPVGLRTIAVQTSGGVDRPILSSLPQRGGEARPAEADFVPAVE